LGHELVHVGQYRQGMSVFDYLGEAAVNGDGPANKYEGPAYKKQREIGTALRQKYGNGPICK